MKHRFMLIMSASLIILLLALFILSCYLNRRQYLANVQSIKADYLEILTRETSNLRDMIRTIESETFALFDKPDLPFDLHLANRLFVMREGQFSPAGLSDALPQNALDPETAGKALSLGMELQTSGRSDKAKEYLDAAARISAKSPEDLDVRISACIELLKNSDYRNSRVLFNILYSLFDYPAISLDEKRIAKYEEILRDKVLHYETNRKQSREIWRTSAELSGISSNRPAPFKLLYNESILSVNVKGHAFLLTLESLNQHLSNTMLRISAALPGKEAVVSRQLRPLALYTWIPVKEFEIRKQSAERAYLITNGMLGILLVTITGMGIGIGLIVKRQHEVTALKSSFVSSVTHELRTPMALIRLYAESLAADNQPPGTRERYSGAIMAETDRLTALVNNVLDFSSLEHEALTLNINKTDVSRLCNEVLDSFSFRLKKEGITLTRNIKSGLMAKVDPIAMTQVVFNLVDNAIKYSGGKQKIEVEMTGTNDKICLYVKDSGIGVPDSLKPRIFMPFVRGDDSRVTSQRGSGIGLSVAHQLLEKMNSTIRVFDNMPEGTVFEIILPAEEEKID